MDLPKVVPKPPRYNPSQHNPVIEQSSLHFRSFFQSKNPNYDEDISLPSYTKPEANNEPEISIFEARKYFDENKNKNNNNIVVNSGDFIKIQQNRPSSVSSDGYDRNFRTSSFHATPTATSEASWNSQTELLVNTPGYTADSVKNFASEGGNNKNSRRRNSGKKWVFRRNCCCAGEKSIRVKEATTAVDSGPGQTGSTNSTLVKIPPAKPISGTLLLPEINLVAAGPPRQQRISASGRPFADGFSFPILKGPTQTVRPGSIGIRRLGEDLPRNSLEVFQPAESNPSAVDGGRRNFNLGSPIARVASTEDDVGSDASSDLFELESFATQTTSNLTSRRRDSLDEAPIFNARRYAGRTSLDEPPTPSVAATECYAPSEVSVTWSVSTAEGVDRASVSNFSVSASETGGAAFRRQGRQEEVCAGNGGGRKGNGGGLLLMSCRQGKAVSVGPHPVRCLPEVPGGMPSKPPPRGKTAVLAFGA
ncbi:phytochrome kinase substrate-related family protein [Striga asiatica]|uniref:Phytochrome kinase substrate-related family protein n=1 Tax=Striga asiatica TaxID=4170 RepID=A0A5A7R4I7_STRAF|nr:phytochrome kinase substrate-related family protein [Striga asiatica]